MTLADAILGIRIAEYVRNKYGARLSGASWDPPTTVRFLRAEANIMLRDLLEADPEPGALDAAVSDAYTILFDPEPDVPLAKVIDINSRRNRNAGLDTRR